MANGLFNSLLLIPCGDDHRTSTTLFKQSPGPLGSCQRLNRWQWLHPTQVPERGQCHSQEQRGHPAEDKSRPHDLVALDHAAALRGMQYAWHRTWTFEFGTAKAVIQPFVTTPQRM